MSSRLGRVAATTARSSSSQLILPRHNSSVASSILSSFSNSVAAPPKPFPVLPPNSPLVQYPATEVTTLASGLRVASEGGHGETATVGFWIDAGSRDETPENNGVAHFLEHMAFKGTTNRSQHELEVEVENMGGHLNAYTSREQTVYYAKVFKKDVPKAIELLSDLLLNAKLDAQAVDRERETILREMEEVNKLPEERVFDLLHETAYQHHSLGKTILGPVDNINKITRDDLRAFITKNYTAPRIVVAGAGAVEHAQLVELADKAFGGLPTTPKTDTVTRVADKAIFTGSDIRLREDAMDRAHVCLAFEGASWTSEYAYPLMVIQTLLGTWDRTSGAGANMASKLCMTAAENELAHSIMSFSTFYKDSGLLGVYAVAPQDKLNDLTWTIMESFLRLSNKVTEEEVARARNQLKTVMISQLDGSSAVCEEIGRNMITYGRRLTPAEVFARIDAVDYQAVRDCAQRYLYDRDLAVAGYGPIHEFPDYTFIRRRSYATRY